MWFVCLVCIGFRDACVSVCVRCKCVWVCVCVGGGGTGMGLAARMSFRGFKVSNESCLIGCRSYMRSAWQQ